MTTPSESIKRSQTSRFQRLTNILIWKCYLQRQRKWKLLVLESLFGGILCLCAVFTAKHVFLTPLKDEPEPPLASADLLASLNTKNILGYAPNTSPFIEIMNRAGALLQIEIISGTSEDELNNKLYIQTKGTPIKNPVIWVIWQPKENGVWKFSIRSTERAKYATSTGKVHSNPHLRAGFLAVQMAISQAILEHVSGQTPKIELTLVSMPVSPLMQEDRVRRTISEILLCFTLALLPPVLEIEALVVSETVTRFKRALRIRQVEYSAMYIGWLVYAYLTVLPISLLSALTMILIFRWIHLFYALLIVLAYVTVMIMLALIMAMFHSKAWIACVWTTLFTLLQMYLAEMLVHHEYDLVHVMVTFLLHVLIPPLGLVHALNHFALLQTGRGAISSATDVSLFYTIGSWSLLIPLYFSILMLLQRTIGQDRAIGGQVSWKSVIFKKVEDVTRLSAVISPTGKENERLQEVDELVAKAISFRNVTKCIMGVQVLNNITLDIYRGEFTMIITEREQENLLITLEDLLSGVTHADSGTINILGHNLRPGKNYMSIPHMMGYCHSANVLVKHLTVQEHLTLFLEICLANESKQYVSEYGLIRSKRLLKECDLEAVKNEQIHNLDIYYRAQLCWAIAILMEPRIVIMPYYDDSPNYRQVIKDKIMQYKKFVTLVKLTFRTIYLEYADRIFLFDSKLLVFGGTPAYMFFKYGREYRLRLTLKTTQDEAGDMELLERASQAGATVRAHLGFLLILRLPTTPTANVAEFLKDLTDNATRYGMLSMYISLADSEEVCKRAISELRTVSHEEHEPLQISKEALRRLAEPVPWKRKSTHFGNITHLRNIAWKYVTFYVHYRLFLILTIIVAIIIGILIGLTLSILLTSLYEYKKRVLRGQVLTVEQLGDKTTLVLRLDKSDEAISIANAYVLSETNATEKEIERIVYTALSHTESLTEYLVTRAIDSPQHYVYMYAYGMDVSKNDNDTIVMQVLYSPLHYDEGAAARSLARAYMALIRHYTNSVDASIQVTDDPLSLDLTPWMKAASMPPILVQFLLILLISHIILLPSNEHGLIRHMQKHAMNFSPARYWFTLYFCDLILYWMMVILLISSTFTIMYLIVPTEHFQYGDLMVLPFMFVLYGVACIPQAYVFSLGSRAALNAMSFVIVNVVFGETTVLAKIFYGDALNYALLFMNLSPQFNFAYAYVKIKQIFLYNSECIIFNKESLCSGKTMHKCCQKCGVLQNCFARKGYLNFESGVLMEMIATVADAIIFMTVLLLLEYKVIQRVWRVLSRMMNKDENENDGRVRLSSGVEREINNVLDKRKQLQQKTKEKVDTFGEYLLAHNVSKKHSGVYKVRNVCLGLGKGQALALSGLRRHGRLVLCKMLAGYTMPNHGHVFCMSKWQLDADPHMYARQITLCCNLESLPPWMTVHDALELMAVLRGIPKKHIQAELKNYIDALELQDEADMLICRVPPNARSRLHLAAAVIGAPPVIVLDECTAHQRMSVRRAIYHILYYLRKRGHAIFISSSNVESHMPVTNRLAMILDGEIYDIDNVDSFVERYSNKGYTVVVHLKDEVDVQQMFAHYFNHFVINDSSEVLVNIQVMDEGLTLSMIFQVMEKLQVQHQQVYSYIVCTIPIDYIYNSILTYEVGNKAGAQIFSCSYLRNIISTKKLISPAKETLDKLIPLEKKYEITRLTELPWSVIFQR